MRAAKIEGAFESTRELIKQVHAGLNFFYGFKHQELLKELASLTLGLNPADDEVRIATLIRVAPTLKPAFPWIAHDGFTLAALVKGHKAQQEALQEETALGEAEKSAAKALRLARPASKQLWADDTGLDTWIKAHLPAELQYAFGRERRTRPRAVSTEPGTTMTAASETETKDADGKAAAKDPAGKT